uniref:Uncharacterized protein n=1 Tax=Amphimedon queenslandica TaxID=400682 RepID=A0A1X7VGJ1_AMPQE
MASTDVSTAEGAPWTSVPSLSGAIPPSGGIVPASRGTTITMRAGTSGSSAATTVTASGTSSTGVEVLFSIINRAVQAGVAQALSGSAAGASSFTGQSVFTGPSPPATSATTSVPSAEPPLSGALYVLCYTHSCGALHLDGPACPSLGHHGMQIGQHRASHAWFISPLSRHNPFYFFYLLSPFSVLFSFSVCLHLRLFILHFLTCSIYRGYGVKQQFLSAQPVISSELAAVVHKHPHCRGFRPSVMVDSATDPSTAS